MTWNIILCDDDPVWCGEGRRILLDYGQKAGLAMTVRTCMSAKEVWTAEGNVPDAVFMDIELEEASGIDAAYRINQIWPECQVVFLTNFLKFAVDVYQVRHTYFVLKEEFAQRLDDIFRRLQERIDFEDQKIAFSLRSGKTGLIRLAEITHLERRLRETLIKTADGEIIVKDKLDDVLSRLPADRFIRCHNSYIVNLSCVKEFRRDAFLMEDGTELAISRSYQKKVREQFAEWIRNYCL